jgi:WD40 repeat protein
VRALAVLPADRTIAVFDEGSVGLLERGASAFRRQAPQQDISVHPAAHAVAVGANGSVIVLATAQETIIFYRCNWSVEPRPAADCRSSPLGEAHGRAVAISPDEQRIAVGEQAGTVTVYDLAGTPIGSPATFDAPINALGWAQMRDWLAVGTVRGEIAVLDVGSGGSGTKTVIARQAFGDRPISTLAWSPQALDLAFACNGSSICLWRFHPSAGAQDAAQPTIRFEGHANTVTRLSFAPAGTRLASAAADGTIRVWSLDQDMDAGFALHAEEAAAIGSVAASHDGRWIAGGDADGAVRLWDAQTGALARVFKPSSASEVNDLAWSQKGRLASIHADDTVNVISPDAQVPAVEIKIKTRAGMHLAWTDADRTIAVPMRESGSILLDTQSPDGEPVALDGGNGKDEASGIEAFGVEAWGVAASVMRHMLFVSYVNGKIRIWDLAAGKSVGSLPSPPTDERARIGAGSLSLSPDGRWLASSGGDRFVTVYDIARRSIRRMLKTQAGETLTVAFSPDGRRLAALSSADRLYVWQLRGDTADLELDLELDVGVIPRRVSVGNAAKGAEHAQWLDWLSNDNIAIATGSAAITVVGLDPAKWLKRIDGLAPVTQASVK